MLERGTARSANFFVAKVVFGAPLLLKQDRLPPTLRGFAPSTALEVEGVGAAGFGEDFAGVHNAVGIDRGFNAPHQSDCV